MKTKLVILIAGAAALLVAGILLRRFQPSETATSSARQSKDDLQVNTIILSGDTNKYFDNPAIVVTDTAGKSRPFSSIEGKVLFFRFRNTDHKKRYEAEIERLKKFAAGDRHYKSIALLVSLTSSQSIDSLQHAYHIPFAIYQVEPSLLRNVSFEKIPLPYYFLQEENKSISHLSVPASQDPEQTEKYLQSLKLPAD